jgi:hypothetical protein
MVCVTSQVGREADSGVEMMIGTEDSGFDSLYSLVASGFPIVVRPLHVC